MRDTAAGADASWAADGFSLLATGKSVTDHGLSAVTDQDCAMWRVATTGEICIDEADDGVAFAELEGEALVNADPGGLGTEAAAWAIADTAAAEADAATMVAAEESGGEDEDGAEDAAAFVTAASFDVASGSLEPGTKPDAPADKAADVAPPVKFYYVIASFARRANAETVSKRHADIGAGIVEAQVDGRLRHRVVVGPVPVSDRRETKRRLIEAGIEGGWPLRLRGTRVAVAETRVATL